MIEIVYMKRQFRVVTHKRWLAEQFAPMGAVQDHGFPADLAKADPEAIYWAPGAWVASVANAGVRLPLMSCGPYWLDNLPSKYRSRGVRTLPLSSWSNGTLEGRLFVKLPEVKMENFPAQTFEMKYLATSLKQFNLPPDTLIQVQGVRKFYIEARFWVAHGEITAESLYRIGDLWWGEDGFIRHVVASEILLNMRTFAREVIANVDCPPGFTLDIGIAEDGEIMVVEANAAWSSGPYDGDSEGIYEAIEASHDFNGLYPQWAWNPPPVFTQ